MYLVDEYSVWRIKANSFDQVNILKCRSFEYCLMFSDILIHVPKFYKFQTSSFVWFIYFDDSIRVTTMVATLRWKFHLCRPTPTLRKRCAKALINTQCIHAHLFRRVGVGLYKTARKRAVFVKNVTGSWNFASVRIRPSLALSTCSFLTLLPRGPTVTDVHCRCSPLGRTVTEARSSHKNSLLRLEWTRLNGTVSVTVTNTCSTMNYSRGGLETRLRLSCRFNCRSVGFERG